MSFCHVKSIVWDLQRVWLHIWAILDYMEIYKSCMDGLAFPADGVANTVGTFMSSIHVAQDMFLTGLPCWLIQTSSTFLEEKIYHIVNILPPKDILVLEPHKFKYPVIFKGHAGDDAKYHTIDISACNFLYSKDPFALSYTSTLAGTLQPSTSSSQSSTSSSQPSTPAVTSSSATCLTGWNSQGLFVGLRGDMWLVMWLVSF